MEKSINEQLIEKMVSNLNEIKESSRLNNVPPVEFAKMEADIHSIADALRSEYGYREYGKMW